MARYHGEHPAEIYSADATTGKTVNLTTGDTYDNLEDAKFHFDRDYTRYNYEKRQKEQKRWEQKR